MMLPVLLQVVTLLVTITWHSTQWPLASLMPMLNTTHQGLHLTDWVTSRKSMGRSWGRCEKLRTRRSDLRGP
ncbi:hypothetical protein EDB89DRAFT_1971191 [Lactarius sanguifluus]|nr:hypothetical protein EDB89DRAFT_1971191 [Lactarius sanguifluus]